MSKTGTAQFHGVENLEGKPIFKCKYQLNAKSEIVINFPNMEIKIGNKQREGKTFKLNFER